MRYAPMMKDLSLLFWKVLLGLNFMLKKLIAGALGIEHAGLMQKQYNL
jgi:hypothetical protein